MANKAFEDGFYEVSLELLERFLKNYPSSKSIGKVHLLIGQCYFRQNKFLEALKKFESLIEEPYSAGIKDACLYWIAEVHFKGNNFLKAAEFYKKIIDGYPKSPYLMHAYYSLGWCYYQEHLYAEALSYFKSVEEKFPKETVAQDASFKTVEALYNLKRYGELKDEINAYLGAYPDDKEKKPYLYFYMAEADYYLEDFTRAIEEYSKVTAAAVEENIKALSRLGMGWSFLKQKDYAKAEDALRAIKEDELKKDNRDILFLAKASLSFEKKDFAQARDFYGRLRGSTSDPLVLSQAYLGEADALYNMALYQDAIALYSDALKKYSPGDCPQDIMDKLHYGLAWAMLKEGEFKGAIEQFQKIVKQTDDKIVKVSALCHIGDAYQDSGDYKKAQEAYDSILKNYPDSFYNDYVQYQLGLTLLRSSNYDGAIIAFQNVKSRFPGTKLIDDAAYALGLAYFQREDYNSSREVFSKFRDEFAGSSLKPQAVYLLGSSLYNLGEFSEAIEAFKDIIKSYGQDIELVQKAEYEIADCYYRMGNEKEAMSRLNSLRTKYPDSALTLEVVWWLGEYYYRKGDFNLSRRYFLSLVNDFPKSDLVADAYYYLGLTYEEDAKYEEAVENFKKVTGSAGSDLAGQAYIRIADIYIEQGKLEPALEVYFKVKEDYSNLAALLYPKIGDLYRRMNNFSEAINFYLLSLDIAGVRQLADIQFKIAESKEAMNAPDEAVEEYLKVPYLYSENGILAVRSFLRVAAIYESRQAFDKAEEVYKKLISMGVEEAKYAQERIDWIRANVK
ncbi:MAG: tetratricopeptide repeat protein [Candidatus Omnitrophica bacterium]|nr:tetratricopeptide repeat protein [Candidatus Omnitrophota bacterium]